MTTVCANKKRPRAKKSRSRTPTLIHTPIKTTDKDFGGSTRFRGTLHARSERDSEIAIQLGACVQFSLIGTARKKFNTFLIQIRAARKQSKKLIPKKCLARNRVLNANTFYVFGSQKSKSLFPNALYQREATNHPPIN